GNASGLRQADFRVAQVAAGVFTPQVAFGPGAGTGVAVADRQPLALVAAAGHGARVFAQAQQQRVGVVQPDVAEAALAHVAHGVLPPVGVRVHGAGIVDVGDAAARGVAAPGAQHLLQARAVLRQTLAHPLQQQDGVGVVVAGDEVGVAAVHHVIPGLFEQLAHGVAGHAVVGVGLAAALAAP